MTEQHTCEECGLTYDQKITAEVCAETDRQLSRQAMLGLASSRFLEWSREGREVIERSKNQEDRATRGEQSRPVADAAERLDVDAVAASPSESGCDGRRNGRGVRPCVYVAAVAVTCGRVRAATPPHL